jgi:ferredoxin-NADP reductase
MPTPVKVQAQVKGITAHGDDVFSLRLSPLQEVPRYLPGQFLHLALDAHDPSAHWPESRVFSIATSPTRATELSVTFAVKGPFTRRMATSLRAGDMVWLKLPYGSFTLRPRGDAETVLIAGGTGITPFVAYLEFALDERLCAPIALWYGAKTERLLLYRPLIEQCAERLAGFQAHYCVESSSGTLPGPCWRVGRLAIADILSAVSDPGRADVFLSGPAQMITAFTAQLRGRGIGQEQIHVDAWA